MTGTPGDGRPAADTVAPLHRRAAARLVDLALGSVPALVVAALLIGPDGLGTGALLLVTVVELATMVLYETVAVSRWSATVGKRLLGLRVVRLADGGTVQPMDAAVRASVPLAVTLVPAVGPALALVVYLRAVFHPLRQGLHDAAGATVVVSR